jgi:hypothetical protein
MTVTYVGPKLLVALSSKGLGGISTATTPVVTVNSSLLDTARRISVFSTAGSTSMSLVVTGVIEGGGTKTEVMIGSSSANTTINSVWDYVSLTSVVASSNANIPVWFGTSSIAGTPWKLTDWNKTPLELSGQITLSTSANSMSGQFDVTLDDPTFTIGRASPVTVPVVFNSTSVVGAQCSTNTLGPLNVDAAGIMFPVAAWRLTITSSSTSAGTVSGAVMQTGV